MQGLFFILYGYLFIRGAQLLFKKIKPGVLNFKKQKFQRLAKLFLIIIIMLVNIFFIVLTDKFINILNIENIMTMWIWLNGLGILLLELPWFGKYDISLLDITKNKDESISNKNTVINNNNNNNNNNRNNNRNRKRNIPLLGPDDEEEKSDE